MSTERMAENVALLREFVFKASSLLLTKATAEFEKRGPHDARGAAIWDAAMWLHKESVEEVLAGNATTPDQDLINAATVIKRIANRSNRHPNTAAILLPIAEDLRRRAYAARSTEETAS